MIDSNAEHVVSLADAARLCPKRRGGKRPHVSCIYRWTTSGCRGVILESIQIGGTRCTSIEALQRFFDALTATAQADRGAPLPPRTLSPSRQRQIEAAERRLARAGVYSKHRAKGGEA
jgi:hypothetical protein